MRSNYFSVITLVMIRILNISHWPRSQWSYQITEELLWSKTFLLTTTRTNNSNILSSVPGYTLCSIAYQLNIVWKKHCYSWQTWSFTITARTTFCDDQDRLSTTSLSSSFRKHWSTLPFMRVLSGLAFIKKLTWHLIS